ncbi:hypothetical protein BRETT_002487 [Brettanomyces bruxellensis]|uniref:DnaJ-domain-containing protein n=1 Tax=Dekkera bruxellensis TaxID=5007 RepID=A0A871RH78_DEKBR|nr:uncharacterized protein BRETT_002487 [Brettanomyces bruxellensis]QOU22312.1 hypothetical protein BRETT_002487 [Brettanomyces bruxellensis]
MTNPFFVFVLLVTLIGVVLCDADYYKVLGVSKNADAKEIKTAYRNLSKKYHPDKNPGDDSAQQKFMEIGEAYEVLNDPDKRAVYDRYGKEGLQNGGGAQNANTGGRAGDPFDMFSSFFGGARARGGRQGKPRGRDYRYAVGITLKDFYNGKSVRFHLELQDICDKCEGTGSEDGKTHPCPVCQGRGRVIQRRQIAPGMFQQFESPCGACHGSGRKIDHLCKKCHGQGVYMNQRTYTVDISPGEPRNHVQMFQGESNKSPEWIAGDLDITLRELPQGNLGYRRIGSNLYRTEVLTLKEALTGGWERTIPFLDTYEPDLKIRRKKGVVVQDGEIEKIRGKGMPIFEQDDEHGDLFIEYKVISPTGNSKLLQKLHDEL